MTRADVQSYLEPGERILWTGHPPGGLIVRRYDLIFGIFVWPWSAIVIGWLPFMVREAAQDSVTLISSIFYLPFLAFALYATCGKYVLDAIDRRGMVYAVTDRRAIIVSGVFRTFATSQSITLDTQLRAGPSGQTGQSLMIGPGGFSKPMWDAERRGLMRKPWHPFCFERIADAGLAAMAIRYVQSGRVGP